MKSNSLWNWLTATGVVVFAGCSTPDLPRPSVHGPYYVPANHTGVARLPSSLHRVALLPVYAGATVPDPTRDELDAAIFSSLNRAQKFETITVSREQMDRFFGARQVTAAGALPHDLLQKIQAATGVDAVMLVDITEFSPYPPLVLGLRAKLASITDGTLLWSFDSSYNSADPAVANSARRYAMGGSKSDAPVDLSRGVLQSPGSFASYAAASTFDSLPPR